MRKPSYYKAIIICHGKSELILMQYIKTKLRLPIFLDSDKKGEKSIQINGLKKYLETRKYNNYKNLSNVFGRIPPRKNFDDNFKVFIIMDTDDCENNMKKDFIEKKLFKEHWLCQYIVPIYNNSNLEDVLTKAGIKFKKHKSKKEEYVRIFPSEKTGNLNNGIELEDFKNKIKKTNCSNLHELIDFCLNLE